MRNCKRNALFSLFAYAALSKLRDFERFQIQLGKSPLTNSFASLIAWVIPLLEITICVMLVVRKLQYVGLFTAYSMMIMFSVYIVIILQFADYIPCSCGGILENMSWKEHFVFNISFVAIAIIAILNFPNEHGVKGTVG